MVKLSIGAIVAALVVAHTPGAVSAQVGDAAAQAQAEARGRLVCGAGTLVSAQYVPPGLLRVTCSQQTQSGSNATNAALAGTGLAALPIIGAVLGVAVLGAVGGGGNPVQTTDGSTPSTSTTTTTSSTR
ncbi:MAG: hypothetical protein AB3N13_05560 [Arenibacterium sp.]